MTADVTQHRYLHSVSNVWKHIFTESCITKQCSKDIESMHLKYNGHRLLITYTGLSVHRGNNLGSAIVSEKRKKQADLRAP